MSGEFEPTKRQQQTDYGRMRADLMRKTMGELRAIARAEGICLGYAGSRKASAVDEIVAQRKYRDMSDGERECD